MLPNNFIFFFFFQNFFYAYWGIKTNKIVPPNEDKAYKSADCKVTSDCLHFDKFNGHASVTVSCASSPVKLGVFVCSL